MEKPPTTAGPSRSAKPPSPVQRLLLGLMLALLFTLAASGAWRLLVPGLRADPFASGPVSISTGALMALSLPGADGERHSFAEWQGKPLVINFWATWCLPCREELPLLRALSRDPRFAATTIVGVAIDDPAAVQTYLRQKPLGYPVLLEQGGVAEQLAARLGDPDGGLPFTALLNREGRVVETRLGPWHAGELETRLAQLLAASH